MTILDTETTLDVPESVAKCPYCEALLQLRVTGSVQQEDGSWAPDEIQLDCVSEPAIDDPNWRAWLREHSDMPYVYWFPVEGTIIEWLQANYRVRQ